MRSSSPPLAAPVPAPARTSRAPAAGVAAVVGLMALAVALPKIYHWHVHPGGRVAPLYADWDPRVGLATAVALGLAVLAVRHGPALAACLSWPRLLATAFSTALAWMLALATVDGWAGVARTLEYPTEYLRTTRHVHDLSAFLHGYVARIPLDSAHNWPVQLAGHPPGAALFFVLLGRSGADTGLTAGLVLVVLAATVPLAVLGTVRRLGDEATARRVAPLLVLGPSAIWLAVSSDALYAAVAAWAVYVLAVAATATRPGRRAGAALGAGLLFGCCVLMSYGLVLLALLAGAVLARARARRAAVLVPAAAGVAAVVLGFAAAGFAWWRAYPVLHERYYAGIAALRPTAYWVWADLAALGFSAGPVIGASAVVLVRAARHRPAGAGPRSVVLLGLAGFACVLLADASLMSKAEVERIWLPFVPWLLLPLALLPGRWRRGALAGQLAFALAVQTLLATHW